METEKRILGVGSTGRQGGAVTKHLLKNGWSVRALTRNSSSEKAAKLKKHGADVVQGDLDDPEQVRYFFEGVYGVFSVQNPWITGLEKEIEHGKLIADLAKAADVKHIVYSSAGPGSTGSGVPHFDSKVQIEKHIKELQLPYTILRPSGFMEMMSDKDFVPALVTWNVTGKMLGDNFPVGWIAVDDIGAVAAKVFAETEKYIGKELDLTGDIKCMSECRSIYRDVNGKNPFRIPAPVWLFKLMQKDLYKMYAWTKSEPVSRQSIIETKKIIGETTSVEKWMASHKNDMG